LKPCWRPGQAQTGAIGENIEVAIPSKSKSATPPGFSIIGQKSAVIEDEIDSRSLLSVLELNACSARRRKSRDEATISSRAAATSVCAVTGLTSSAPSIAP
jgi:hypothetical protein